MEKFNILVTYHPRERKYAMDEIADRLEDVGSRFAMIGETGVDGLAGVRVPEDPKLVVSRLHDLCEDASELFNTTYHWIPIDRWVRSTPREMQIVAADYGDQIIEGEKWMMFLTKRHYPECSTDELIEYLTDPIHRGNVDLENPTKTLVVQIIEDLAGFSLCRSNEILHVNKVREERGLQIIY